MTTMTVDVELHLASGKAVRAQIEVPADLDDAEIDELLHRTLTAIDEKGRGTWQQLGDVHFHTAAVQAVALL